MIHLPHSPGNVSQCEITGYIGLDLLPFFENNLSSGEVLMRTTNHPPLPPESMVTLSSESNQNSHLHKESGIVTVIFVINDDIYVCLGNMGQT